MLFQDLEIKVSIPETSPVKTPPAINELLFGEQVNRAVENGQRADFALLLAMFSNDVREITPVSILTETDSSDQILRQQFCVPAARKLRSDADSYTKAAAIADSFHKGGLYQAQLQSDLCPDALAYMPEHTYDLGEEVFRNLSLHEQRCLSVPKRDSIPDNALYHKLIVARRSQQIQAYA